VLRTAQSKAVAEETTYRVDFTAPRTLEVFRFNGSAYVRTQRATLPGTSPSFGTRAFVKRDGSTSQSAFFYARGTASAGSVTLQKQGTASATRIDVVGLTGRVNAG
jgi:hypothetical protein